MIIPRWHKDCVHTWWCKFWSWKYFYPIILFLFHKLLKGKHLGRFIRLVIFTVSCLQDGWLNEVICHDIKWIGVIVGVMISKENNLVVPWCFHQWGPERANGLHTAIVVHITIMICMDHPVSIYTISQVSCEDLLFVDCNRINEVWSIWMWYYDQW